PSRSTRTADLFPCRTLRQERLDLRHLDLAEVVLDALGLAVELVDVELLSDELAAVLKPLEQLARGLGLDQADRALPRRGVAEGRVRDGDELADALAPGEGDRPRLDKPPVDRERVIEPPRLDDALERVAIGLPPVAGPLEVEVPAGRGAEQPGGREGQDAR